MWEERRRTDRRARRTSAVVVMKSMASGSRKPMCGQLEVALIGGRDFPEVRCLRLVERQRDACMHIGKTHIECPEVGCIRWGRVRS